MTTPMMATTTMARIGFMTSSVAFRWLPENSLSAGCRRRSPVALRHGRFEARAAADRCAGNRGDSRIRDRCHRGVVRAAMWLLGDRPAIDGVSGALPMSVTRSDGAVSVVRTYIEMTKPRIIELLLVTTIPAMVVAADGWPGLGLVIVTLLGGTLTAGGANVINQVYDADIDKLMRRTAGRPLPTDRVSPSAATWFGGLVGAAGFVVLAVGANLLAGLLAATAFIYYVVVYTMVLKRSSTQNIVIGGAAGAIPALIGWAAYADSLSLAPWVMFAMIVFWTPPHFWALSLKYEDDYRAASVPMLPVVAGEAPTFENILWYSVVAAGTALMLPAVSDVGWIYGTAALVLGATLVWLAVKLRGNRDRAMRFFVYTNLFLAGVFLAMMVDTLAHVGQMGDAWLWMAASSALVAVGVIGVVVVERGPTMRAKGVSVLRHTAEVGVTVAYAIAMVLFGWQMVVG